jgi:hypothetical protein
MYSVELTTNNNKATPSSTLVNYADYDEKANAVPIVFTDPDWDAIDTLNAAYKTEAIYLRRETMNARKYTLTESQQRRYTYYPVLAIRVCCCVFHSIRTHDRHKLMHLYGTRMLLYIVHSDQMKQVQHCIVSHPSYLIKVAQHNVVI